MASRYSDERTLVNDVSWHARMGYLMIVACSVKDESKVDEQTCWWDLPLEEHEVGFWFAQDETIPITTSVLPRLAAHNLGNMPVGGGRGTR